MQIVVPAAGRGSRFVAQGYTEPKPLINVLGKPLIKWATDGLKGIDGAKFIFLVLQEYVDSHEIDKYLKKIYPGCAVIAVKEITQGAACTVLLAKDQLDMNNEMFIVNCDNLFFLDMAKARRLLHPQTAAMISYVAANHPHWSYVQTDGAGNAIRVAEKEIISDKAIVGCAYFTKAKYFIEAAEYMIANDIRTKGEFYVSPVFNIMISRGLRIQTVPCDLHFSLGTPEEVENFRTIFSTIAVHSTAKHESIAA